MRKTNIQNLLLILILSIPALSYAETNWLDRVQIHGFASQGLIFTSDNSFYGDSKHGSADFTELGINASLQLSSKIRIAGQALSRHAGDMDNGSPRIDYALIDVNLLSRSKGNLGIYLGRIKNPLGLFNETRDVAHTRQGVFTQQAIYFDKVRDIAMSSDGAQLYGEYLFDNGTLLLQAGFGYPIPDENVETTYMNQNWAGSLEANRPAIIGRAMYEHDGGRWIFSLSGTSLELDFEHGAADAFDPFNLGLGLSSGTVEIDYTILSTQYNGEKWQFTGEIGIQEANFVGIGGLFSDADTKPIGFTFEANYRFTPKWQAYLRSEIFYLHRDDKLGSKFNQDLQTASNTIAFLTGGAVNIPVTPAHSRYSKAWVVGGRWDINKHLIARADYHLVEGTATLSSTENNMPTAKKYWNMLALSLSYRF